METTSELKDMVIACVNSADERLLKMLKTVIEAYYEPLGNNYKINDSEENELYTFHESMVAYEKPMNPDTFELTEERKKILDERLKFHEENPDEVITLDVLKDKIKAKYGF